MTSRRDVVGLLCLAPFAARAQQGRRMYRVGVLETTSLRANAENFERFRKGMEERGYVEGPSLVIAYRSAEGRTERFAELAAELVRSKVDLLVTRGTPATLAAKAATSEIPIVMAAVADPVESGLAASLARPGGNVTGLTSATTELAPKRLELLKALVPKMTRVAVYANLDNIAAAAGWRESEQAARAMGIEPVLLDVRSAEKSGPRSTRRCAAAPMRCSSASRPWRNPTATPSSSWQTGIGCRPCTRRASSQTPAGSWPTAWLIPTSITAPPATPTASSRARGRPSWRSNGPQNSPFSSTAAPRTCSA